MIPETTMNEIMLAYLNGGYTQVGMSSHPDILPSMPKELFFIAWAPGGSYGTIYGLTFKGYWVAHVEYLRHKGYWDYSIRVMTLPC